MQNISKLLNRQFLYYALISLSVTAIDMGISYALEFWALFPKFIANGLGMVIGFTLQYIFSSKVVFKSRNKRTFIIFFVTFIIGWVFAQGLMLFFRDILFDGDKTGIAFLVSKAVSMLFSFFFTYFTRKNLIPLEKPSSD